MPRLIAMLAGIDPRTALRIAAGTALLALILMAWSCAREGGREAERTETAKETAQTVQDLEETYDQIDEGRAASGDGAAVERLRDGSFFIGGSGGEAPLPAD